MPPRLRIDRQETPPGLEDVVLLRLPEVLRLFPVGKSTWWAGVKSGRYPRPVRTLGARITAWRVEDIRDLIRRCSLTGECGAESDA